MAEAVPSVPIVRDYDAYTFCLVQDRKFIVGGFEPNAKPAFDKGIPENWRNTLEADYEQFGKSNRAYLFILCLCIM